MIKLVRGQDNVISLHITATYPVGEVGGTFVAKGVTIPVPQSRNGTEFKFTAADVESIGEDFMIGIMTIKNEANEEVAVVRVPLAILPEGSDNRGFTDVRITLVSIREVEGGDHGGSGVKMFQTKDGFPVPGNVRYICLAEDTGKMYRWDAAARDYVEVSGVVQANLAETDPEKDGYVLNRQTHYLENDGWDGVHPYASVANFVPDYSSAKTYSKDEVAFHVWETAEPGVYDNGIFKCLADGTTVAPPDASKWIEIDLKDLIGKEVVVTDKTGATPTGGEEIWIDEAEIPESQSYNDLVDKPQINGHELTGNKTSRQLGIVDTTDLDKKLSKQRVDGDATKGQVEWEELDDHSGCLKVTGVVKGTNVETADGNHNLANKADKTIPSKWGNLAALAEDGNLIDSSIDMQDLALKMQVNWMADKDSGFSSGQGDGLFFDIGSGDQRLVVLKGRVIVDRDGKDTGEQSVAMLGDISALESSKADRTSLAPEYSETSAYSVGSIVYQYGNIYQCKTAIAGGGEAWNAEHWELRKLSDFFTESNSLLTGTIDARLPYPLYAVADETGLLKDRAINTTSLASVTVPDNFTDLLIRASVASSLAVTMPETVATKYGDTFPGEAGEYLITITKTGASEAYVRTIKLEVA